MSEHPCSSQISKFIIRNTIHEISRGRRLERSGACCPRFFETSCACGSVSCRSDVIRCGLVPVPEYDHGFLSEAPLCRADLRFSKAHHPQHRHLPALTGTALQDSRDLLWVPAPCPGNRRQWKPEQVQRQPGRWQLGRPCGQVGGYPKAHEH